MPPWVLVAVGGALGALGRYGIGVLAVRAWGAALPVGTWVINLSGSFLIGLVVPVFLAKVGLSDGLRLAVLVGFLGSFTTFSTFSLDTLALLETGRPGWALANAFGSVVLGVALAALGLWLGRQWV
jgi:fluoride exporter